jgi:hypothetical protein|tara:strand:+ start:789 stop:986 length:198 start_codon:yes stop_codon:yes gene_type:complete
MTKFTDEEKQEFKAKSVARQNTAWEFLRKSEKAYDLGKWELSLDFDKTYCRLTDESIYYAQLCLD